jgi:hypothetical protein
MFPLALVKSWSGAGQIFIPLVVSVPLWHSWQDRFCALAGFSTQTISDIDSEVGRVPVV